MKKRNAYLLLLMIALLLLDQGTKILVEKNLDLLESIEIIEGFFSITYICNTGAAWSILEGKMVFFYVITIIAIIGLCLYFTTLKQYQILAQIGIAMSLAGAIGNFIDRLAFQYVRDFLDFIIFGYDFPVFNVADSCLCIGIAFIIIDEIMDQLGIVVWKKETKK